MSPRAWRRQNLLRDALHPPENVRVVVAGVEHAVQTVYVESEPDGTQVYEVVDAPPGPVTQVLVARLPGQTSVRLPTGR